MDIKTILSHLFSFSPDIRSRKQVDSELHEEFEFHLDCLIDELCAEGVAREQAIRLANERMGDMRENKEKCRGIILAERLMIKRTIFLVICMLGCVALGYIGAWGVYFSKVMADPVSPFTKVAWDGWTPHVEVDGQWYELIEIDGILTDTIMDFCRKWYDNQARKRFSEDLGQVLHSMGLIPGNKVDLTVRPLDGPQKELLKNIIMTNKKRKAGYNHNYCMVFDKYRWQDSQVLLNGQWYELIAVEGIRLDDIFRKGLERYDLKGDNWNEILGSIGHPLYSDTLTIEVKDLETNQIIRMQNLPNIYTLLKVNDKSNTLN